MNNPGAASFHQGAPVNRSQDQEPATLKQVAHKAAEEVKNALDSFATKATRIGQAAVNLLPARKVRALASSVKESWEIATSHSRDELKGKGHSGVNIDAGRKMNGFKTSLVGNSTNAAAPMPPPKTSFQRPPIPDRPLPALPEGAEAVPKPPPKTSSQRPPIPDRPLPALPQGAAVVRQQPPGISPRKAASAETGAMPRPQSEEMKAIAPELAQVASRLQASGKGERPKSIDVPSSIMERLEPKSAEKLMDEVKKNISTYNSLSAKAKKAEGSQISFLADQKQQLMHKLEEQKQKLIFSTTSDSQTNRKMADSLKEIRKITDNEENAMTKIGIGTMHLRNLVKATMENAEIEKAFGGKEKLQSIQDQIDKLKNNPKELAEFKKKNKDPAAYFRNLQTISASTAEINKLTPTIDNIMSTNSNLNKEILAFQSSSKQLLGSSNPLRAAESWWAKNKSLTEIQQGLISANNSAFGNRIPFRSECDTVLWNKALVGLADRDIPNAAAYQEFSRLVSRAGQLQTQAAPSLKQFYDKLKPGSDDYFLVWPAEIEKMKLSDADRQKKLELAAQLKTELKGIQKDAMEIKFVDSDVKELAINSRNELMQSIDKSIRHLEDLEKRLKNQPLDPGRELVLEPKT